MNEKPNTSLDKARKICDEIKENVGRWYDYFAHNIEKFRDDKEFYNGKQWSDIELTNYESKGKKALVHNMIKPIGRQILGELKNMQPDLNLIPADALHSNPQNDMLMSGLVRHIGYNSKASQAYSTSLLNQMSGGWGVLGLELVYDDDMTFDQTPKVRRFTEPQNVFFDPIAKRADKMDGAFCGTFQVISEDNFKKLYPKASFVAGINILGNSNTYLNFVDSKSTVIVEYYRRETKRKTLVQLTNSQDFKIEVLEADVEQAIAQYQQYMTMNGIPLLDIPALTESNRRKTKVCKIKCYKVTNDQILEQTEWVSSKLLPFAFVDGMSSYQDGKQITESFIFSAKTPQKVYNYAISEITAGLAKSRKESAYMTPTQMKGHEHVYENPDRQLGNLPYNVDPQAPQGPIPRPPDVISPSIFQMADQAKEDIQRTLGIYEPNRGQLPNDTSGVAIGRTIMQANLSLVLIMQNLYDGMQAIGELILDVIPKVYDTERVVSLLDATGQLKNTIINQVQRGGNVNNDVTSAVYKLEIKPVATFEIQKQMVSDMMFKLAGLAPQNAPLVCDLIASLIDSPISGQLVKRLQTTLPPQILQEEKGLPPTPQPPSPQEQLLMGQIKTMQIQQQKMMEEIKNMQADRAIKAEQLQFNKVQHTNDVHMQVAELNLKEDQLQADLAKVQLKTQADLTTTQINAQTKILTGMAAVRNAEKKIKPATEAVH